MKRTCLTLTFLLCLYTPARAQTFTFDGAMSHPHGPLVTATFSWIKRDVADTPGYVFLGNVIRLRDAAGKETWVYYRLDDFPNLSYNLNLIFRAEGVEHLPVRVTYDPVCRAAVSIELAPAQEDDAPDPRRPRKKRVIPLLSAPSPQARSAKVSRPLLCP